MNATPLETTAVGETAPPTAPALPPPEELRRRGLFAYHDGTRPRLADQVEVQFRIQGACPGGDMAHLDDLLAALAGPSEPDDGGPPAAGRSAITVAAASVELARLAGVGFDLPPLDEATARGLSVQERLDLLSRFFEAAADSAEAADDEGGDPDADAGPGEPAGPES